MKNTETIKLTSEVIRKLSIKRPYISLSLLVLNISSIISLIVINQIYGGLILYFLSVIWIGARAHGLAVLIHDLTHGLFFNSFKTNIIFGEILSWFLFYSMGGYRKVHLTHHKTLNTEDDPDFVFLRSRTEYRFNKSKFKLIKFLLENLFGLAIFRLLNSIIRNNTKSESDEVNKNAKNIANKNSTVNISKEKNKFNAKYLQLGFYIIWASLLTYFNLWLVFLLFWIVPLFTYFHLVFRIRVIAEHLFIQKIENELIPETRTTVINIFEKFLICPNNINYHLEHHIYPSVPFYNLPKLHRLLMEKPAYAQSAHISYSYFQVFKDCVNNEIHADF